MPGARKSKRPSKKAPVLSRADQRARVLQERHERLLEYERRLWSEGLGFVAGLDEVGAGPLAGPVVAACVVLHPERLEALVGVNDSKQLTELERERLAGHIREQALGWAVAEASVLEIDRINILQASLLAMRRALTKVQARLPRVEHLLIDARKIDSPIPQTAIVKGDSTSLSIAAASILAKVARDAQMVAFSSRYPQYGFDRHKGYATADHLSAVRAHGVTPLHRQSFEPIRSLGKQLSLFE